MTKWQQSFRLVSLLFLIILGILIWRTSVLFTEFTGMFSYAETGPELVLDTGTTSHEASISLNNPAQIVDNSTDSSNFGHYETIEETIARIKRDVYATGAIISAPGQEVALFQIEGMPDRSFKINTQLMDGFIITEITNNHVALKNQIGDETFSLKVGNNRRDSVAESLPGEAGASGVVFLPGGEVDPGMGSVIGGLSAVPGQYGVDVVNEINGSSGMIKTGFEPTPRIEPGQYNVDVVNEQYGPNSVAGTIGWIDPAN